MDWSLVRKPSRGRKSGRYGIRDERIICVRQRLTIKVKVAKAVCGLVHQVSLIDWEQ